eukprot:766786-Hanusia_phi.AAC.5
MDVGCKRKKETKGGGEGGREETGEGRGREGERRRVTGPSYSEYQKKHGQEGERRRRVSGSRTGGHAGACFNDARRGGGNGFPCSHLLGFLETIIQVPDLQMLNHAAALAHVSALCLSPSSSPRLTCHSKYLEDWTLKIV